MLIWPWPSSLQDREQVHPTFEQVGGKAVAQGVDTSRLGDARTLARPLVGALGRLDIHGLGTAGIAKQPGARAKASHVGAQQTQQRRAQNGVSP